MPLHRLAPALPPAPLLHKLDLPAAPWPAPMASAAGKATDAAEADPVGFQLGWDHALHGQLPPVQHLHPAHPVRQGWQAGRQALGDRRPPAPQALRQWLALRLSAWTQGRPMDLSQVTPGLVASLAQPLCPVRRRSPQGVASLRPWGAVQAGELVMLDPAVLDVLDAGLDLATCLSHAQAAEPPSASPLSTADWQRLAGLMSLVSPLAHEQAAQLPLWALPSRRLQVINPVQGLQVVLSLALLQAGWSRAVVRWAQHLPHGLRRDFHVFIHSLWARQLALQAESAQRPPRQALEDAWCSPVVQRRWQRFALPLGAHRSEALLQQALRLGLAGSGVRACPARSSNPTAPQA